MLVVGFFWTMFFSVHETYMTFSGKELWLHIPAMIFQISCFIYLSMQMKKRYGVKK